MNGEIRVARRVALEAGKFLAENFDKRKEIRAKGFRDFVSNVDVASEKLIKDRLGDEFPGYGFLAEESGQTEGRRGAGDGSKMWVIDPLDGTNNYVFGLPFYGVSIALANNGVVEKGVIYLPFLKETYVAERGRGATLNGKKIHVSGRERLRDSIVIHSSIRFDRKKFFDIFADVVDNSFGVRIVGVATMQYSFVACGRADALVEHLIKPWDYATGALLVEEAGGRVTEFSGKPWSLKSTNMISSNGKVHDRLLSIIQKHYL